MYQDYAKWDLLERGSRGNEKRKSYVILATKERKRKWYGNNSEQQAKINKNDIYILFIYITGQ